MKKKVIDGKLTVIRPKKGRRSPASEPDVVEETIGAVRGAFEAGARLVRAVKRLRGK